MKNDNTLVWENIKHLQQVQHGIESLQSKYKALKRKEIFNFSFMNLCYHQKPLVMPKLNEFELAML